MQEFTFHETFFSYFYRFRETARYRLFGSIAETQEMLDFCGRHNITADVEVIPIQKVNEAYERLLKSDVKYRFSIDMASLKSVTRNSVSILAFLLLLFHIRNSQHGSLSKREFNCYIRFWIILS